MGERAEAWGRRATHLRAALLLLSAAAAGAPTAAAFENDASAIDALLRRPQARCEEPADRRAGRTDVTELLGLPVSDPEIQIAGRPPRRGLRNQCEVRLASLGPAFPMPDPSSAPSLTGAPIRWVAKAGCLAPSLRDVLEEVAANFGPLRVNSTCRSKRHNARVGGAKRSFHLTGNAADFRIDADVRAVHAFLREHRTVGGLKHYGRGVFHIDTGPRRTW